MVSENLKKWDDYFLSICNAVARNSKCMSRKIGCILVRDKSIIATGYNGPARGIPACNTRGLHDPQFEGAPLTMFEQCPRRYLGYTSGQGLHICTAAHAEVNCISNAARMGVITLGATLYTNCEIPCKECMTQLINSGISEIVVIADRHYDETSKFILMHSNLKIRCYV